MARHTWFWLSVLLCAVALVASAILFVDYVRPGPVFCDGSGGCGVVRQSALARPFGVPLPAFGLVGLLAVGLASLVPGPVARRVHAGLASIAALAGLFFLAAQVKLGAFCPFCAAVDVSSVGVGIVGVLRLRKGWDPPPGRTMPGLAAFGLAGAVLVPALVGFQKKPRFDDALPSAIKDEILRTGRGKVTIVDFADFECPYCRMNHAELAPILSRYGDKVRVVRKHVPLSVHPHAMIAAKAGCCAENLGKGEPMADALFSAPPGELTPEGCEKLAEKQGLDLARFRACVSDPATDARIQADKQVYRAAKCDGLPTLFVDGTRLEGAQEKGVLEATIGEAVRAL